MKKVSLWVLPIFFLAVGVVTFLSQRVNKETALNQIKTETPYQLRWVIAHYPERYFLRMAELMDFELRTRTGNQLSIEIVSMGDDERGNFLEKRNIESSSLEKVASGDFDIVQVYSNIIAQRAPKFHVYDLPFLFENHEHVDRVVEGEIGKNLLAYAGKKEPRIEGLAYTYSGGFMVIPSKDIEIDHPNKLIGKRYRTYNSLVHNEIADALGAIKVYRDTAAPDGKIRPIKNAFDEGLIDAGLQTYADTEFLYNSNFSKEANRPNVFNETNHRLYLTSIFINKEKMSSLPKELQDVVREVAFKVAREERNFLVEDSLRVKKKLQADGIKIVNLSPEGKKDFIKKMIPVYENVSEVVGTELIEKIKLLAPELKKDDKFASTAK